MTRVGMLSFAHVHANGYAEQVTKNANTELVAIWDHLESRGQSAAETVQAPFYNDLDKVLELDLDAVVVNVETNRHPEVMVAAARAGKHIFTEKLLLSRLMGATRSSKPWRKRG